MTLLIPSELVSWRAGIVRLQAGASVIKIYALSDISFSLLTALTDPKVLSIVYHDCTGVISISICVVVKFWLVVTEVAIKSLLLRYVEACWLSLLLELVLHEVV